MSLRAKDMITFISLLVLIECIRSLKLLDLRVPGHVPQGTNPQLSCRWALEPPESLYSVKWYKDGKEFFRHVPKNQEPRTKFKLPGVEVEEFDSLGSNLTLSAATLDSSGRYRCEVSGEKPLFPTVSDHADMKVIVLPDHGPILSGLRPRYKIGDRVDVTCTSGRSWPSTQLGWYINGEPAPVTAVRPPTYQKDHQGLEITRLMLNFIITEKDFKDNRIKIKCLATLYPFYWKSNEESAIKQRKQINREREMESTQIVVNKGPISNEIKLSTSSGYQPGVASIAAIRLGSFMCFTLNKIIRRH